MTSHVTRIYLPVSNPLYVVSIIYDFGLVNALIHLPAVALDSPLTNKLLRRLNQKTSCGLRVNPNYIAPTT